MGRKQKSYKSDSSLGAKKGLRPKDLLRRTNRGILLDVVVFIANLFLMRMLMNSFISTVQAAYGDDKIALLMIFLYFVSLMFLAPVGAVLKRWHFHERVAQDGNHEALEPNGCLFSPILYYSLMVTIFAVVNAFVFQYFYGDDRDHPALFIGSIFLGMIGIAIHTWLVYRYFSPPAHPPRSQFLQSPISELIGDICIFVNMLFFQIMWNLISQAFARPTDGFGIFANLLGLIFVALLIYFPPRMLYLAEDIGRRRTWFFIFLANLPVIYHAIFGSGRSIDLIH